MLKIKQDNLGQEKNEDEDRNIEENDKMMPSVIIDMSEKEMQDWKAVFKKLLVIDNIESGEIDIEELINLIMSLNDSTISYWWRGGMTLNRDDLTKVFYEADCNKNGHISICEFYKMWAEDCSDISRETKDYIAASLKTVSLANKKCPPPLFVTLISILQIIFFINNTIEVAKLEHDDSYDAKTTYTHLIFNGNPRSGGWQYLTYSLVHRKLEHLLMVLLVQLALGIHMEMVHGSISIGLIYLTGVFSGSLSSFVFNPQVNLFGGSGGCYSLLGAQLATVILNVALTSYMFSSRFRRFRTLKTAKMLYEKRIRNLKLFGLVFFMICDVIVFYYISDSDISYVAHAFGFISGFFIAFLITKDKIGTTWEKYSKIILSVNFAIIFFLGVLWNFCVFGHC